MGEITEALRRAKNASAPETPGTPEPLPAPAPTPVGVPEPAPEPSATISIPHTKDAHWVGRAVTVEERGSVAEHYRHFAIRTRRALDARRARSLVITSAVSSEGKTTTACNLALALASMSGDERIALVDLDLRRPGVARSMGITAEVGVDDLLSGEADIEAVRVPTNVRSLDLFLARQPRAAAHELLATPRLAALHQDLLRSYGIVVVDAPPVLMVPDVPMILEQVQVCITVARVGVTREAAVREMLGLIPADRLIGAFLNDTAPGTREKYQRYYE